MRVWQRGIELAKQIYPIAKGLPREERYALADQLRRAAVSISANIAEGSRRTHQPDFARFLNIAEGSAAELESLLQLTVELGYRPTEDIADILQELDELQRMLLAFRRKVEKQIRD
jgi:four helix bundle protein